ncbi:MAG: hypothetical protein ACFFD4_08165 [Candidatus Odinarchaeota archaeon]
MGKNSRKILTLIEKEGAVPLAELPDKLDMDKKDVYAAVNYLKKKNRVKTEPLLPKPKYSIVLPADE